MEWVGQTGPSTAFGRNQNALWFLLIVIAMVFLIGLCRAVAG